MAFTNRLYGAPADTLSSGSAQNPRFGMVETGTVARVAHDQFQVKQRRSPSPFQLLQALPELTDLGFTPTGRLLIRLTLRQESPPLGLTTACLLLRTQQETPGDRVAQPQLPRVPGQVQTQPLLRPQTRPTGS